MTIPEHLPLMPGCLGNFKSSKMNNILKVENRNPILHQHSERINDQAGADLT